jgi:hypothetical protein
MGSPNTFYLQETSKIAKGGQTINTSMKKIVCLLVQTTKNLYGKEKNCIL